MKYNQDDKSSSFFFSSIFSLLKRCQSVTQTDIVPILRCSVGWWVAMDRGGAGTISQLFRTLTVDLFSHNPPMGHYSLLTPLSPPLLPFLSLAPSGNVTLRKHGETQ